MKSTPQEYKLAEYKLVESWWNTHGCSASHEGWNIFACEGSSNGRWQICHYADPDPEQGIGMLDDDDCAWELVMAGFEPHHVAARSMIQQLNPLEWDAMCRYMPHSKIGCSTLAPEVIRDITAAVLLTC